ncbi:MAG: hypothetical protein AAF404_15520 [Pseudomonadota bacterium]
MNIYIRSMAMGILLLTVNAGLASQALQVVPGDCQAADRYCDIQSAIDAADAGDVITLSAGDYELWQESITINKAITLQGESAQSTRLLGEGDAPLALINITADAEQVVLKDITVADRTVSGSAAMGPGGLDHRGGDLTIDGVVFKNNRGGWGGAVRVDLLFGTVLVRDSEFTGNTGFAGGGLAVYNGNALELVIEASVFRGNNAVFSGGAVLMRDVAQAQLINVQVVNNTAGNTGGGVHVFTDTGAIELMVESSTITGNEAAKVGGLSTFGDNIAVALQGTTLKDNKSRHGLPAVDCGGVAFDLRGENTIGQQNRCQK